MKKIKKPEDIVIVTVTQTDEEFTQSVADYLNSNPDILTVMIPKIFSGGEYNAKFIFEKGDPQNLNGKTVYLLATQGAFQNPQDVAMRIFIASRAAKENGADKVILVATDLSYSRQDRGKEDAEMLGEANTSRLYAELLKISGIDETITIHLHNERVAEYHNKLGKNDQKRIFNIQPASLFSHYLLEQSSLEIKNEGENLVFISPDSGAEPFVREIQRQMFLPKSSLLRLNKIRKVANHPGKIEILNPKLENTNTLNGKIGILSDDIIDTGGTLIKVIEWLFGNSHDFGKLDGIIICFTHPVLGGKGYKHYQTKLAKIKQIIEFVMLGTRPFIVHGRIFRFKGNSSVLRIPNFFGDIIIRHNNGENIEEAYVFKNKQKMIKTIETLYEVKRSAKHFMEKNK